MGGRAGGPGGARRGCGRKSGDKGAHPAERPRDRLQRHLRELKRAVELTTGQVGKTGKQDEWGATMPASRLSSRTAVLGARSSWRATINSRREGGACRLEDAPGAAHTALGGGQHPGDV